MKYKKICLLLSILFILILNNTAVANNIKNSAVVFMYHKFDVSKYPSTNIKAEQFEAHLNELSKDKYNAELRFVVENTGNSGSSIVSGIASQFGLDMSQGETTFSQQNVLEILKSRGVISSALLKEVAINNSKSSLITHYLIINGREDLLSDKLSDKIKYDNDGSIFEDSVLTFVWNQIIEDRLIIELQTNEANIIRLSYKSYSQKFGKYFVESLIDEMSISIKK